MARASKAQYELLTEAFGEAYADIQERDSPLLDSIVIEVARKVGGHLKYDNPSFDIPRFIEGIESVSELQKLSKKGINL